LNRFDSSQTKSSATSNDPMKREVSAQKPRNPVAECVSGVLLRDGSVLVEKRRADDDADPGLVLLPGGHVELGESLSQALKREIREELGIQVETITPIRIRYYTASNGERQRIHYFRIKDWRGKIRSNEAEIVYWESDISHLSDTIERKIVLKLLSQVSRV
jgi:8-oxo-dGTP diphosphatase